MMHCLFLPDETWDDYAMWRHLTWCLGEMPWRILSGKQQQQHQQQHQHACIAPPHFIWLFCFASSSFCLLLYHTFGFYFSFCCHQTRDWFSRPFPSPDRTNVGRPRQLDWNWLSVWSIPTLRDLPIISVKELILLILVAALEKSVVERIKSNQSLLIHVVDWVASDIKCLCNRVYHPHHAHTDSSSSFSGRRRKGETSTILSESYQWWRRLLNPKTCQRWPIYFLRPSNHRMNRGINPVDLLIMAWKWQARYQDTALLSQ